MKLFLTLLLIWLFAAYACHTPARQPGVQVDSVRQANSITKKRAARNNKIDSAFLSVWTSFVVSVKVRNFKELRRKSMDSIQTCDSVYAISSFLTKCFGGIFDSTLLSKINDSTAIELINNTEIWSSLPPAVQKITQVTGDDAITLKEIVVIKVAEQPDSQWMITFDFIPTKKGYLFYSCNSVGGPICCR
jgi:hypothetical protein